MTEPRSPSAVRLRMVVASTRYFERGALPVLTMDWVDLAGDIMLREERGLEREGTGSCFSPLVQERRGLSKFREEGLAVGAGRTERERVRRWVWGGVAAER